MVNFRVAERERTPSDWMSPMDSFMSRHLFKTIVFLGLLSGAALYWDSLRGPERMQEEAAARGLPTTELSVREIRCSVCRDAMADALRKTKGVVDLAISRTGVTIVYEPNRTFPQQLADVVDALGFHASVQVGGSS
jgi:copper chaperone CopZ